MKAQVILLAGYLNCGKTTYCEKNLKEYTRITVSSIVRKLSGATTRKELQDTANLDHLIAKEIISMIEIAAINPSRKFVIDGIRQPTIYQVIRDFLADNWISFEKIWLDVPREECERRFYAANSNKEKDLSFADAWNRDADLGLLHLQTIWKETGCTIVKHF